jgi:hypothetical protein
MLAIVLPGVVSVPVLKSVVILPYTSLEVPVGKVAIGFVTMKVVLVPLVEAGINVETPYKFL